MNLCEDPKPEVGVEKDQGSLVSQERDSGRDRSWTVKVATLEEKDHSNQKPVVDRWRRSPEMSEHFLVNVKDFRKSFCDNQYTQT